MARMRLISRISSCIATKSRSNSDCDLDSAIEQDRPNAEATAIFEMIGGHPCLAPTLSMVGMSRAVEIGCGTGIATTKIAEIIPSATVHGLDLSDVPQASRGSLHPTSYGQKEAF